MSDINRREFLKLTGATIAAASSMRSLHLAGAAAIADTPASQDPETPLSLPKGGGAIRGIGETFQADLFKGTANFTIPIQITPGRTGFGPDLSLEYSSGYGNGPFGLGWKLSIPRITRKTEQGIPQYTDGDVFLLSGADDLVPMLDERSGKPIITHRDGYTQIRYRPRIEGLFARIEKWVKKENVHWRITTKDNITSLYGKTKSARIIDPNPEKTPGKTNRIFEWLLEETFDAKGNHILYEYVTEKANLNLRESYEQNRQHCQSYIRRILYGNTPSNLDPAKKVGPIGTGTDHLHPTRSSRRHYAFEVLFDYGDFPTSIPTGFDFHGHIERVLPATWPRRKDPYSSFRSGFEVRTLRRCGRILMLHHFNEKYLEDAPLVRSVELDYDKSHEYRFSLLNAIIQKGHRKDLQDDKYLTREMPPLTFKYSPFRPENKYKSISTTSKGGALKGLDDPDITLLDLFGNGLPDILDTSGRQFDYWRNRGNGRFDPPRRQESPSFEQLSKPDVVIGDMTGNGLADLIIHRPHAYRSGFFEASPFGNWSRFKHFTAKPKFKVDDPSKRLIDLTGDGLSDVLISRLRHFEWYQCKGAEGFGDRQIINRIDDLYRFPNVEFRDCPCRVRLADMSGDGLLDIVFLDKDHIYYWPNLGYGCFGSRITMDNSPELPVGTDIDRLYLVDLDGTGCVDLVYVQSRNVHYWFNRSGNSWSDKHRIAETPGSIRYNHVGFADLLGTGTATLVWSKKPTTAKDYQYLDFCSGLKPYLLTEIDNNMGATTRLQYAPSTEFYIADQGMGKPWATNLPFPVHVLKKVEKIDHISKTKLVTTYQYHHGHYDGREREFQGFGRVDQYDIEEFKSFSSSSLHGNAVAFNNNDKSFHVKPTLTKTWFHTGVYFDECLPSADGNFYDKQDMMAAFRKEFYKEDKKAFVLEDHDVEHTNNPPEAYRALRGSVIRSEVYALDGIKHPYTLTENRYQVKEIQRKSVNKYGVYLTAQKERLDHHYERNPADPRIRQTLTLNLDGYGNVTESVAIGYPRRQVPDDLSEQGEIRILYTRSDFINKDDSETDEAPGYYYVGVPCQTRRYEVTGIQWKTGDPPLNEDGFPKAIRDDSLVVDPTTFKGYEWERPPSEISVQRRIIEWTRAYFRKDDEADEIDIYPGREPVRTLSARLNLGDIAQLGLPYEAYQAAFTKEVLDGLYSDHVTGTPRWTKAMLEEGAYYKEDDYWWIPSGQQKFETDKFFLPTTARDPFGQDTTTTHDPYALLPTTVVDAKGNVTSAIIDYRVLQPRRVKDPNGSISEVAFDALGLVVGTAVFGKDRGGNLVGDSLMDFVPDLPLETIAMHLKDPLNQNPNTNTNPNKILQKATTRLIYDLKRSGPRPPVVYTLARETHVSDVDGTRTKIKHSFVYSDGFGRETQTKVQAEPGRVNGLWVKKRWVGTGTKVYNNKGKPVRQFEPFFSDIHDFGIKQQGVSPVLFYDPLERLVCTVHPNKTYGKGLFDPWYQQNWDGNDTVLLDPRTDEDVVGYVQPYFEQYDAQHPNAPKTWHAEYTQSTKSARKEAAAKTVQHADTPTTSHLDTLGRTFLAVQDNGPGEHNKFHTRVELDIEGNDRKITDPRNIDLFEHRLDIAGRKLRIMSHDAGPKTIVPDVAGQPIYAWDGNDNTIYTKYDALRRPDELWVNGKEGNQLLLGAEDYLWGGQSQYPGAASSPRSNMEGLRWGGASRKRRIRFQRQHDPRQTQSAQRRDYASTLG